MARMRKLPVCAWRALCAPAAWQPDFLVISRQKARYGRLPNQEACGRIEPAERDALRRLSAAIGAEDERAFLDARLVDLAGLAITRTVADEAERIGKALCAADVVEEGVTAATVVGLVSEGLSAGELELLRALAVAAQVSPSQLATRIEDADRLLSGACRGRAREVHRTRPRTR